MKIKRNTSPSSCNTSNPSPILPTELLHEHLTVAYKDIQH